MIGRSKPERRPAVLLVGSARQEAAIGKLHAQFDNRGVDVFSRLNLIDSDVDFPLSTDQAVAREDFNFQHPEPKPGEHEYENGISTFMGYAIGQVALNKRPAAVVGVNVAPDGDYDDRLLEGDVTVGEYYSQLTVAMQHQVPVYLARPFPRGSDYRMLAVNHAPPELTILHPEGALPDMINIQPVMDRLSPEPQ